MTEDLPAAEGGHPPNFTQFLAGRTHAYGVFQDRFGRVRRSFKVVTTGRWDGSVFVLDETFDYSDGAHESRQWRIAKGAGNHFSATCTDCVGVAHGVADTRGWRMRYGFRLRLKTRTVVVRFDDRMICVGRHLAINRARVSKWGVTLGEVLIVFERQDVAQDVAQDFGRQDGRWRLSDFADAAE